MIYIDLDDVACETCDRLAAFARQFFDRDVTVESMIDYDLRISFNFDEETYRTYMRRFHATELLDIPETPQACRIIREWFADGLDPVIVTGRPTYSHAETRQWLDNHGLGDIRILHVDKYAKLFNIERPKTYLFKDIPNMLDTVKNLKGKEGICLYYNNHQDILKVIIKNKILIIIGIILLGFSFF